MGSEIVYCSRCQTRIRGGDFEDGKAFWSSEKPYCVECIMGLVSTLPPEEEQGILETLARKRGPSPPPEETPRRGNRKTSTARIPVVKPETASAPPSSPTGLLIGVGLVVLVLVGLVASMSSGPTAPSRNADPPRAAAAPIEIPAPLPAVPPPDLEAVRREKAAKKALEKARAFARSSPADFPGRIALLEEAAWEARGTSLAEEARREHELLQKEHGERIARELAPPAEKARTAAKAERFGEALDLLRKERHRLSGADWTSAVDQVVFQIRENADQAYAAVREKAIAARKAGMEEQVQAAIARVASWGIADLSSDLRDALAAVPPPPPALAPDVRAYLTAWENAAALARARDYAAAVQGLDAAASQVRDPAVRKEAASDLELLKLLASAHADILQFLIKSPKGTKLSLETDTTAGPPARVEGQVVRATGEWIELRKEPDTVVVGFDDLAAASLRQFLGKLPGRKPEVDARLGALFLVLEGEAGGAAAETLPASFRAYGDRVRLERGRKELAEREDDARARFEEAERDYQDPAAILGSFAKYRALQASHADTAFLRRKRPLVARRLESEKESAKEFLFFPDQMSAAGGFRRNSHPKAAVCWTLDRDLPPDKPKDAWVEFTFSARPQTEYRCWILAGACCAETFAFDAQGTELAGGAVKNALLFLKKTHAAHGGRKEPARFEWIAVPLPKYASGGTKTIRILSGQQGFSVAGAFVSSIRTAPPADALLKEMERSRPVVRITVPEPIAAWSLDEGTGTAAADSGPLRLAGTLRNDPVWVAGKRRRALGFDGRDDFVEIPKHPKLYLPGPFTVAAWINVAEFPTSQFGMYAVSDYSVEGTRSTLAIRVMSTGAVQFFWQNDDTVAPPTLASATRLSPGTWTHVAGVWDGATRSIYVNGALDGTSATPQPRPNVGGALSIGRPGSFNGLYFRGRIDDVRLFDRALSGAEIQSLLAR